MQATTSTKPTSAKALRAAQVQKLAELRAQAVQADSVDELIRLCNEIAPLLNLEVRHCNLLGVRLEKAPVFTSDVAHGELKVFAGKHGVFYWPGNLGFPGLVTQGGVMLPVPADAPEGTQHCMLYTVRFDLAGLVGLAKTREALLRARLEERAHDERMQDKAMADLRATPAFSEQLESFDRLRKRLAELRRELDETERQVRDCELSLDHQVDAKHCELVAANNAPMLLRADLESKIKID